MSDAALVESLVRSTLDDTPDLDQSNLDRARSAAITAYLSGASVSEATRVGLAYAVRHHPHESRTSPRAA